MSVRLKALLMLLLLGLVLPVAGTPQWFCMHSFRVLSADESCPSCVKDDGCPCHRNQDRPEEPSCMASVKRIPDGAMPVIFVMPPLAEMDVPPFAVPAPVASAGLVAAVPRPRDRAPPGRVALYLENRSLLL